MILETGVTCPAGIWRCSDGVAFLAESWDVSCAWLQYNSSLRSIDYLLRWNTITNRHISTPLRPFCALCTKAQKNGKYKWSLVNSVDVFW